MKKTGIILTLIITAAMLFSCGTDDGIPDGMQLVRGGEEFGYNFYAPEEWTVANQGEISAAYASKIDTTSATVVEAEAPMSDIDSYFDASLENFAFTVNVTTDGEPCDFGNADSAYKYIYEYAYDSHPMRCMQIFASYGDRFYIFTFNSQLAERTEGETYYDFYIDKLQTIIDNFEFIEKSADNSTATEYTKDADGYLLISDSKVCGYDFYIPEGWDIRYSQSNIGISKQDGASLNITEATSVGVSVDEYWQTRKAELEAISDEVNVIKEGAEAAIGNSSWGFAYEYTYTRGNTTYHVYQIIAVEGSLLAQSGYVLTYTAPDAVYEEHIDDVMTIAEKVVFK